MSDFEYEIIKKVGVLSDGGKGYTKEVNLISYNKREPVVDIRNWYTDKETGERKMMKGLTVNLEEAKVLRDLLNKQIK